MLHGSCACGHIRYELRGELKGPVGHCHCWQCRKHSGASFGTTCVVQASELHFLAGQEKLTSWESSPGIHRFFASCCGSPIFKRRDDIPSLLSLRLGTLDTDPGRLAEEHIFVSSKVPWIELQDGLPEKPGGARFGEEPDRSPA
jgi:hypothetical protein